MVCGTRGSGSGRCLLWGVARIGLVEERLCIVEGRGEREKVEMGGGSCKESFRGRKGNLSMYHKLRAYGVIIKSLPLDDAVHGALYLRQYIIKCILHIKHFCNEGLDYKFLFNLGF